MKYFKPVIFFLHLMPSSLMLNTKEDDSGRMPEYSITNDYPTADGIKEVLNRLRIYYESTSQQKIINSETGKELTDLSKLDKDAVVSIGFSSEWVHPWCCTLNLRLLCRCRNDSHAAK